MDSINLDPLIKIANISNLKQFLHQSVDELINKQNVDVTNFKSTEVDCSKQDLEKAKRCLQNFYRECTINKTFALSNNLEESLRQALKDCYEIREKEIFQALAKESILNNGYSIVENFDWRLKWVLGSSSLASLKEPVLQMDLLCSYQDGGQMCKDILNFEANLHQVDNLITELTKVKKEIAML